MVFATNVYFTLLAIKFFTITYCAIYNPYLNKLDNPFMPREIRPLKDKTNDRWAKKKKVPVETQ